MMQLYYLDPVFYGCISQLCILGLMSYCTVLGVHFQNWDKRIINKLYYFVIFLLLFLCACFRPGWNLRQCRLHSEETDAQGSSFRSDFTLFTVQRVFLTNSLIGSVCDWMSACVSECVSVVCMHVCQWCAMFFFFFEYVSVCVCVCVCMHLW